MNVLEEQITVTLMPLVQTRKDLLTADAIKGTVAMESRVQVRQTKLPSQVEIVFDCNIKTPRVFLYACVTCIDVTIYLV